MSVSDPSSLRIDPLLAIAPEAGLDDEDELLGSLPEFGAEGEAFASASETLLVPEAMANARLDQALRDLTEGRFSRERLQTLIADGHVSRNDKVLTKASFRVSAGDSLCLTVPPCDAMLLAPEAIPLTVVFEDAHCLVINKPQGLLTHPTGAQRTGTLVNALLHHCGNSLSGINGVVRPGIVHRLDRDTSGLLVVAKTDQAHQSLANQLQARTVTRRYWAIVHGLMPAAEGYVIANIGRDSQHRTQMRVTPEGRYARTDWTVVHTWLGKYTLLALQLETGRTHQIRVHLGHKHHPVVGDPLYGKGWESAWPDDVPLRSLLRDRGQLLQAVQLAFNHPSTGEACMFQVSPDDRLLAALAVLNTQDEALNGATPFDWQAALTDMTPAMTRETPTTPEV